MNSHYNNRYGFNYCSKCLEFIDNFDEQKYLRNDKSALQDMYYSVNPAKLTEEICEFYDRHPKSDVPTLEDLGITPFDVFSYYDELCLEIVKLRSKELSYDAIDRSFGHRQSAKECLFRLPILFGIVIALLVTIITIAIGDFGFWISTAIILFATPVNIVVSTIFFILLYWLFVFIQRKIIYNKSFKKVKHLSVGIVEFLVKSQKDYEMRLRESPIDEINVIDQPIKDEIIDTLLYLSDKQNVTCNEDSLHKILCVITQKYGISTINYASLLSIKSSHIYRLVHNRHFFHFCDNEPFIIDDKQKELLLSDYGLTKDDVFRYAMKFTDFEIHIDNKVGKTCRILKIYSIIALCLCAIYYLIVKECALTGVLHYFVYPLCAIVAFILIGMLIFWICGIPNPNIKPPTEDKKMEKYFEDLGQNNRYHINIRNLLSFTKHEHEYYDNILKTVQRPDNACHGENENNFEDIVLPF